MEYIIYRVFSGWVAKGIEEAEREVTAGIDGKANLGNEVVSGRRRLCATNRTRDVGIADAELVIVSCVRAKILGFDLFWSAMKSQPHIPDMDCRNQATFRV